MNASLDIQSELRDRILPTMKHPSSNIRAIMLYGSRSNGLHRPDSDYDLLVITGDFPSGAAEYHGFIRIEGRTYPLELRVYSETRLTQELREGQVYRAIAVASGVALADPQGILRQMSLEAQTRLTRERAELRNDIARIEPEEYLKLLRIAFSEIRAILLEPELNRQPVAAFSRFYEALTDFYLSCERLSIRNCSQDFHAAELDERLQSILFFSGYRPARFMDLRRRALRPWFAELLHRLDAILADDDLSTTSRWSRIFDELNQSFLDQFGSTLLVYRPEECEALLREEV